MSMLPVADESGPRVAAGVTPPESPDVPVLRTVGAAFLEGNSAVSAMARIYNSGTFAPMPGYNPLAEIKDTPYFENYADRFAGSRSPAETANIKAQISREEAAKKDVADSGTLGTVAGLVAGAADPVWLLAFGIPGTPLRGISAVKEAFASGGLVRTGALTAAGMSAQEALLHASQETRGFGESVQNVAAGTLLAALIGGGAARLLHTEGKMPAAEASLDQARTQLQEHSFTAFHGSPRDFEAFDVSKTNQGIWLDRDPEIAGRYTFGQGTLYKVRVNAAAENFIDRNKPITQQSESVRRAIADIENSLELPRREGATGGAFYSALSQKLAGEGPFLAGTRRANELLSEHKVPGIMDDAGGLIMFDHKLVEITHKNGVPIEGARPSTPAPAGAAYSDTRNLSPAPYGLEALPGVRSFASKMFPNLDVLENGADVTKRAVAEMAEIPIATKGNVAGETTTLRGGPAADREINMFREAKMSGLGREMMRLWTEYLGADAQPGLLGKAQRMMGRAPEGKLSFDEFDQAVGDALRLGDQHEIPQVQAMAQWLRREVYEPISKRAEAAIDGFEPITPRDGESYAPQIWAKDLIKSRWNAFVDMWTNHLTGQQAVKAAIKEKLTVYSGALDVAETTAKKLASQIESRTSALERVETRQEEVQRFNKFAFRRSEKLSQPLDEMRANIRNIETQIEPHLERLAQLAEDIKAEKINFPEIKEADALIFKMIGAAQKLKQSRELIDTVEAATEYVARLDETIAGFKGGISEASTQAKLARRELGADALVALEKTRTEVRKEVAPYLKQLNKIRKELREERSAVIGKAQGGAGFETNIRERGNVLADQASGRSAELADMEARLAKNIENAAELRAKIENELGAWEGKSAGEAKSAIKAREKYAAEAEATAAAAGKTREGAPRLESADAAVDRAIKNIIASDRDLSRQELKSRAQEIGLRVLSTPEGRLPYDEHLGGPEIGVPHTDRELRGHTAHRAIDLPYDVAQPWLERSATRQTVSYMHSVLPDAVLAERFGGDPNMTVKFKEIADAYADKAARYTSERELKRIADQRDSDMQIVAGMRDRIRGVFGYDQGSNTARVAQGALKINNIISSHMMAVSSLPDFAGAVFRHAFESGFGEAWSAYARGLFDSEAWAALKAQGHELQAMGIGIETERAARQHALDGITESYRPNSRVERALSWASDKSFIINLLTPLTDVQKRISANVAMNGVLRASQAVAEGKATQKQLTDLAAGNIRPDVAERIWKAYSEGGGEQVKGVYLPNTAAWADTEAKMAFQAAVARDVDIAVVTPGQEKPFWMSKPGWNLLGQYSTFAISATQRIVIANLQRADAATLAGLVTAVGMGMLAYRINTAVSGQPVSDRPADWFKEGVSRGGVLGAIDNANTITSKLTGGRLDIYRAIGADKPLSKMAGRNAAEVLLGPTYGKVQNLARATSAAGRMDWTEADTHALRMALMGSNLPYLPRLFDQAEVGFNNAFGIQMKARPQ